MGRMQDQQMSVIGLGDVPLKVATPVASAGIDSRPKIRMSRGTRAPAIR
jgi:hypothetical protein